MSHPNPLDPQILEQLRMLEAERPGLMKELIRLFVADAPKQMRLIEGAYGRRERRRSRLPLEPLLGRAGLSCAPP